jgi:membrane-associated phospholipid phosphatase
MDLLYIVDRTFYPVAALAILFGGIWSIIGMCALGSVVHVLKVATKRERPNKKDDRSFPSGHSATAWFVAAFNNFHPLAVFWAVCVAASRVMLYKHFCDDVIAGAILGAAFGRCAQAYTSTKPT